MSYIIDIAAKVRAAQMQLAQLSITKKNDMLKAISDALILNADKIIAANKQDLENAATNGVSLPMQDRLMLNSTRISDMANGVLKVAALPDPIGVVLGGYTLENGLSVVKKRVPLGVIGIIYESRPNVTVDAAALCLKSGNAVILRGGKEAIHSNIALGEIMQAAIKSVDVDENIIAIVSDMSRDVSTQIMQLNGYIDVLIPRGSAGLIAAVIKNATVPVIETGTGNCHIYIDSICDLQMGVSIVYNAKVSRVTVCNACESLLVHKDVAAEFLPLVKKRLDEANVIMLGCERTQEIIGTELATEQDYAAEFLDYKISVKVVDTIDQAISHIAKYSTHHSEAIVTKDVTNANYFTSRVDSAVVYVNASTRFTDGEVFGMGAEIGISTQKLHARGPMGLTELTSIKYIVMGNGNIRG